MGVQPLYGTNGETVTQGITKLAERCTKYYQQVLVLPSLPPSECKYSRACRLLKARCISVPHLNSPAPTNATPRALTRVLAIGFGHFIICQIWSEIFVKFRYI